MNAKKDLGQFYTTNYKHILENTFIPNNIVNIIEPFAGNGDLLKFMEDTNREFIIEKYDIDPKKNDIEKRDTLAEPPDYNDKFVITNPPYLARNKSDNKQLFDKYHTNDLYKCFIENLISANPIGGILIIPLNFWCSIRLSDINIRKRFLEKFKILHLNIFEERVFNDTSYAICSFQFENKNENQGEKVIDITVFPEKIAMKLELSDDNNYTFGGEIYKLKQNENIKIDRLTRENKKTNEKYITNILLKCIDDNAESKICLSIVGNEERYEDKTSNLSARSYASIIINPELALDQQEKLVEEFNNYINDMRKKYNSLFLTNYRESNSIARKRISFNLAYEIINYLICTKINS